MTTIFGKTNKFLFVFVVFLLSFFSFAHSQTTTAPKVISESAVLMKYKDGEAINFKSSVWTNEGISISVDYWVNVEIFNNTDQTNYSTAVINKPSNSNFSIEIDYQKGKVYCFTPFASKLDKNGSRIGEVGKGTRVCFPNIPYVSTLLPAQADVTKAVLKGKINSFQGSKSAYAFFLRRDLSGTKTYKNDGGQIINKPLNSDTAEFSAYFNDFNTDKSIHCYKSCNSTSSLSKNIANCGNEICLPYEGSKGFTYTANSSVENVKDECQKIKIDVNFACVGSVIQETRPDLDIVLVIDRSGTMTGPAWNSTKKATIKLIDTLKATQDRVALVSFAKYGKYEHNSGLTNDFTEVKNAVNAMKNDAELKIPAQNSGTNIGDGLLKAKNLLTATNARPNSKKIIILLTDGIVNVGPNFNESENVCPSNPTNLYNNLGQINPCIKSTKDQANAIKKIGAEIYTLRYADPTVEARLKIKSPATIDYSIALLSEINQPKELLKALTPTEIEIRFGTILYSLTQKTEKNAECKDVNITNILNPNIKFISSESGPEPSVEDNKIVYHFDKVENGTRNVSFIVELPDTKDTDLLTTDSKVLFKNTNGTDESVLIPQITAKNIIECIDTKIKVNKIATPYKTEDMCKKGEIELTVECLPEKGEKASGQGKCKNIIVTDYLPSGIKYLDRPYSANPAFSEPISTNENGNEKLVWKVVNDMIVGEKKTFKFNISFETELENQLADLYPDSKATAVSERGKELSESFPETKITPTKCKPPPPATKCKPAGCSGSHKILIVGEVEFYTKDNKRLFPIPLTKIPTQSLIGMYLDDAISCMPIHQKAFENYEFYFQERLNPGQLSLSDTFDTMLVLPNSCSPLSTIVEFDPINKFIEDGCKVIVQDSHCTIRLTGGQLDYTKINKKFFTDQLKTASYDNFDFKVLESGTLTTNISKLIVNDKIAFDDIQHMLAYSGQDYCAVTMIESNGEQYFPYTYSKPKIFGKGILFYSGLPRNSFDSCDYNAGTKNSEEIKAQVLLNLLQQGWDTSAQSSCGLNCTYLVPENDWARNVADGMAKGNIQIKNSYGIIFDSIKMVSVYSDKEKGTKLEAKFSNSSKNKYNVWFEIYSDKSQRIYAGQQYALNSMIYQNNNLYLPDKYCVVAVAKNLINSITMRSYEMCK